MYKYNTTRNRTISRYTYVYEYYKNAFLSHVLGRHTRFSPVFETMARNRFENLISYFHISDNDLMLPRDNPLYDKLFKIRPFINSIQIN